MTFFDSLKQNLTTAGELALDKAKTTKEILKLKDQIRKDKRQIQAATLAIGKKYRELHAEDYEDMYAEYFKKIAALEKAIDWKEDALKNLSEEVEDVDLASEEVAPAEDLGEDLSEDAFEASDFAEATEDDSAQ